MDNKKVVGLRLQKARIHKGLTQLQLGKAVGLTDHQIGRRERGVTELSYYDAERISKVLEISIRCLFHGDSTEAEAEDRIIPWLWSLVLYYYRSPDPAAAVNRLNRVTRCVIFVTCFCVASSSLILFPEVPIWGQIIGSFVCPLFILLFVKQLLSYFIEEKRTIGALP